MSMRMATRSLAIESLECRRLLAINPTAEEQEVLQYINRFRTDPGGEFSRMFSSVSPLTARNNTIQTDLDFFKTNGSMLQAEWAALAPVKPLTWNEAISSFSATHNNSMISGNRLFHTDSLARRTALIAAGVNLDTTSGERITSEIVFAQIKSPLHNYAAYAVNWGTGTGGMETSRSHRTALMNPVFEEIGGKITDTSASALTPKVNTFVIANIKDAAVRVSGAVFEDRNGSSWYEAGEGLGGVSVSFEHSDGRRFNTSSFSAGGYQIDLPAGNYKVRASGGSMQHAIVRTLSVGSTSLWINFIYRPGDPPPDVNEPNDTMGFATNLPTPSASVANMSLHTGSDVDFYRYVASANGPATFEVLFSHASGNIDVQLLDASGGVIATSAGTIDNESIARTLQRDTTYFLRVYGGPNPAYTVRVTGPSMQPPVAVRDQLTVTSDAPNATLAILNNDSDPDGARSDLIPEFVGSPPAGLTLNSDKTVRIAAPAGFSGFLRASYVVVDADGLRSLPANIEVQVIDFNRPKPWQNPNNPLDSNGDNIITPSDALLVINFLNEASDKLIPTSGNTTIFGFLDVNGDGRVTPSDALIIINQLNSRTGGEGESASDLASFRQSRASDLANDLALAQLMTGHFLNDDELKRRRGF